VWRVVSKYFDKIEKKVSKREFVTHTGYIGNTRLSVISSGIGTDNVEILMNELDALKCRFIYSNC
jgi:uridine phosphorylase